MLLTTSHFFYSYMKQEYSQVSNIRFSSISGKILMLTLRLKLGTCSVRDDALIHTSFSTFSAFAYRNDARVINVNNVR